MTNDLGVWTADDSAFVLIAILVGLGVAVSGWERWAFQRRDGMVPDELIAAAAQARDARPGDYVAIVVGSSTHAMHRMIGSAAVSLARRSPVALIIVP